MFEMSHKIFGVGGSTKAPLPPGYFAVDLVREVTQDLVMNSLVQSLVLMGQLSR